MSYRSIKRVLGENSLERKCRFLFGIFMLLLIGGSFWGVMRLTEDFVRNDSRRKAKQILQNHLLKAHLEKLPILENTENDLMPWAASRFSTFQHRVECIVLDDSIQRNQVKTQLPQDNDEREIIQYLTNKYDQLQKIEHYRQYTKDESDPAMHDLVENLQALTPEELVDREILKSSNLVGDYRDGFDQFLGPDNTEQKSYLFYQPIVFTTNCNICHTPATYDADTSQWTNLQQVDTPGLKEQAMPLPPTYVLRLTQSYEDASAGSNRTRAILMAAAIVIAFLATAALYAIIRYVIVKPLKYLHGVIQQVSKGALEVRADLNTGDEFEELSKALNKMLRHLVDSQQKLQEANDERDRKIDEQAQLTMKLYEMNQVKSDFLANMSHELRTPLNSIIGFSEVIAEINSLDEKQKGYAKNIRKSGHVLLELINNILDLAKLESGKMEVRPQDFRIEALLNELGEMVKPLTEKKHIELQFDIAPHLPEMFQDPGKIRQILTNLLSNAIKFTPEGGRIKTSAKRQGSELQIQVRDTGIGISDDDRKIVFEKFPTSSFYDRRRLFDASPFRHRPGFVDRTRALLLARGEVSMWKVRLARAAHLPSASPSNTKSFPNTIQNLANGSRTFKKIIISIYHEQLILKAPSHRPARKLRLFSFGKAAGRNRSSIHDLGAMLHAQREHGGERHLGQRSIATASVAMAPKNSTL